MQTTARDVYGIRQALMSRRPAPQLLQAGRARKVWTQAEIAAKLQADDAWLFRGILAIHARQTASERLGQHTQDLNGRGFNRVDAHILSGFAEQIKAWQRGESRYLLPLSARQLVVARERMHKYAGQLARIAAGG